MPPPPILANDAQRRRVIAGLMALLLLLSLGVAYALVRRHVLSAADLDFQAPGAWAKAAAGKPAEEFAVVELLRDKQVPTRQLVVARIKPDLVSDLDQALELVQQDLLGPGLELEAINHEPVRQPTGLLAQGWVNISGTTRRGLSLHALAILTDGQRYWTILLSQNLATRQTSPEQALTGLIELLDRIITTAQPTTPPEPTPAPI